MSNPIEAGFVFLVRSWLIISPMVFIWWFFFPKKHEKSKKSPNNEWGAVEWIIGFGALLSLVMVLGEGVQIHLWFIPRNLGGVGEDGEFVSARRAISGVLGVLLTLLLGYAYVLVVQRERTRHNQALQPPRANEETR